MSGKNAKRILISVSVGAGIGILSSAILIFLMAGVLAIGNIPAMLISPVTVGFIAFGSFCGGFAGAKISGEKGLLCGFFSGLLFFLILWVTGSSIGKAGIGMGMIIKLLMTVSAASVGGIFGVNYVKK